MGVEEEYLLVGSEGHPMARARALLDAAESAGATSDGPPGAGSPGGDLEAELKLQQIETGTHPCTDLTDLTTQVRDGRRRAQRAAERVDARVVALATSPLHVVAEPTPSPRYLEINRQFGLTAREQLTCGCHVHVSVDDDDEGVAVLDRIGPWLPPLLALSGNSPFWQQEDSGYASFRSQVWNRWPTAGPAARFGSADAYHQTVQDLIDTGAILDAGMIYFDARLSARYPTVEVRVADVCLRPDDAALLAALVRGLVETAARQAADGDAAPDIRVEQLRAASWRAGRSGLRGDLVSPTTFRPVPARVVVDELVDHVAPALADTGDLDLVHQMLDRVWVRGNGADAQRAWFAHDGDLEKVVARAVEATHS
ncbi:glutamate--cysteine ligase [Sanguibacter sp. 25GB23B1]|uniref:carboxylate-amine ligase n=1 Tax=unclassified Sanguibacter TaxID=2645534 RepID=UPI0032AFB10E